MPPSNYILTVLIHQLAVKFSAEDHKTELHCELFVSLPLHINLSPKQHLIDWLWCHLLRVACTTDAKLSLKRDGTCAETRFHLSAQLTNPFKSPRVASVQSTAGSRGVRISGSNAGYTMFRGSLKSTGSPTPFASSPPPSLCPTHLRHRVPSHFNWTLRIYLLPLPSV